MRKPKRLTAIPGPRSKAIFAEEQTNLAPGLQGFALMSGLAMDSGKGSWLTDVDGNDYVDFIGGIGVNGLGHSHPKYVKALQAQLEKLSVGSFTSEARAKLVKKVASKTPGTGKNHLNQLQLYSGGSEAVESAMRLAKSYTGKWEFMSFWGGFHGKTLGTMGMLGDGQKQKYGPFAPGMHSAPYADCYRCPFKLKYPSCGLACVEHFKKTAKTVSTGAIAAVVVEPFQGTSGNIIPPKDWLPAVAQVTKELGALLICDEMITGFGRTGSYFASQDYSGVTPDIITVGKSFGGGFPVSGVITTSEIAKAEPWSKPSGSSSSYGGNPLAAVAALTTIEVIEDEKLCENSQKMGERMLQHFKQFQEKFPFIGEVRGRGLFLGIELVKDRETKEGLSEKRMQKFYRDGVERGLLAMSYKPVIRFQPALTIDAESVDVGCAILAELFAEMAASGDWKS